MQLSGLKFTEDVKYTLELADDMPPAQRRLVENNYISPRSNLGRGVSPSQYCYRCDFCLPTYGIPSWVWSLMEAATVPSRAIGVLSTIVDKNPGDWRVSFKRMGDIIPICTKMDAKENEISKQESRMIGSAFSEMDEWGEKKHVRLLNENNTNETLTEGKKLQQITRRLSEAKTRFLECRALMSSF